jgi:hypothetical protein
LFEGIHGRPFFATHGVDEDHAGHVFRIAESIAVHYQATKGVANQDVGRLDAGELEQVVRLGGAIARSACGAAGAAPAEAAAVIGNGVGKSGDGFLDVEPVEVGGCNAGFKQHGGPTGAFFQHIKAMAAADINGSAGAREAEPVAMRANDLVEESRCDQNSGEGDDRKNDKHG